MRIQVFLTGFLLLILCCLTACEDQLGAAGYVVGGTIDVAKRSYDSTTRRSEVWNSLPDAYKDVCSQVLLGKKRLSAWEWVDITYSDRKALYPQLIHLLRTVPLKEGDDINESILYCLDKLVDIYLDRPDSVDEYCSLLESVTRDAEYFLNLSSTSPINGKIAGTIMCGAIIFDVHSYSMEWIRKTDISVRTRIADVTVRSIDAAGGMNVKSESVRKHTDFIKQ